MGSGRACYCMGEFYFEGLLSLPKDKIEAKYWLNKCVESDTSSDFKNTAKMLLEEIQSEDRVLESE